MIHWFDVEVATEYGVIEAILLSHLYFWVTKNEANDKHFHDGRYWTYNSRKAFQTIFPYVSDKTISRALKHLEDEGLVVEANYNSSPYDKTLWYSLTDLGYSVGQNRNIDWSKCPIEEDKLSNREGQSVQPIPDNIPDNNLQIKNTEIYNAVSAEKTVVRFIPPTVEEVRAYCAERNNGIDAEAFVAYYDSVGWMVGNKKMKQWKSAVITWEKKNRQSARNSTSSGTRDHSEFYKNTGEWSS